MCIEILKYIDPSMHGGSETENMHKETEKIEIKRGVRQGDTIPPKLFTVTLDSIFRRLSWENKGVNIEGDFLNNLRFADDIFVCTVTPQHLQHNYATRTVTNSAVRRVDGVCVCMRNEDETRFDGIGC